MPLGNNLRKIYAEDEDYPGTFFSVGLLAPATSPARNQWATIMVEQLPKIGIGVVFDYTSWAQIYSRTWYYLGPYPIPTYDQGGYDIVSVGFSWGLEYDPRDLYHSECITPNGDNFYQFNNSEMDFIIDSYLSSNDYDDKLSWAHNMQQKFYEEQPSLTVIYPASVFPYHKNFTGWNGILWNHCCETMEEWTIPGQSDFHYVYPVDYHDFFIYTIESEFDYHWLNQIYISLFKRDNETKFWIPHIASNYNTTDGYNWTITINSDVV